MIDKAEDAPLAGLRVLDLSRVLAGPYATMLLGDLGADVIKVESPHGGDDTRSWGPPFVSGPDGAPESTYFLSANRGKRSVVVDLKSEVGLELVRQLAADADVLVENFRPGVMERLGLGVDRLAEINPSLVVLSISGFGRTGPGAGRVGYDQIVQAEGGLMSVTGVRADEPVRFGVPIADLTTAMLGTIGALAALLERERSGNGQLVSTSLLASQIALHSFQGTRWLVAGEVPGPGGNHHPTVAPYGLFSTATTPIVIAVGNDTIWRRFASLVGLDAEDARFATNADRIAHSEALRSAIDNAFAAHPAQYWIDVLSEAAVPAGVVNTVDHVYDSEQVRSEGLVHEVEHASLGPVRLPGRPIRFSRSRLGDATPPPTLDQHGAEIRERLWKP